MPTVKRPFQVIAPLQVPTNDKLVDRALDAIFKSLDALLVALGLFTVVTGVELANGVTVTVTHNLGRAPRMRPFISALTGATASGRVNLIASTDKHVQLQANGYGATVTVDVLVL